MSAQEEIDLDEELSEIIGQPGENDIDELNQTFESAATSTRGRPKLPTYWSRVIHVTPTAVDAKMDFPLVTDIELQGSLRSMNQVESNTKWELLFYPKEFAQTHVIESLDDWKLSDEQLKKWGKKVTKLREDVCKKALKVAIDEGIYNPDMDTKFENNHCSFNKKKNKPKSHSDPVEPTPSSLRKRSKLRHLSIEQKVDAVHRVFIGKEK